EMGGRGGGGGGGGEWGGYGGDRDHVARERAIGLEAARGCGDAWVYGELLWWATRADPDLKPPARLAEPYELMIGGDWYGAARIWEELGMPDERALALAPGAGDALREALAVIGNRG